MINLNASLHLPKGTEHFLSDIHGEYGAFSHVLRSGSGAIKRRIDEMFTADLSEAERQTLATLIYYPEQKLPLIVKKMSDPEDWYRVTLSHLIRLCRVVSSKYTRAAVREALPGDFANLIEELLHDQDSRANRQAYYRNIVDTIIATDSAPAFIIGLAKSIQRLAIARLHIIGDVYDRGPGAHKIMDTLLDYHAVDFQWGNHDIVWMGAAAGSGACMANVIRVSIRYDNLETLENGYAISLLPLASFAMDVYGDDPCSQFTPILSGVEDYTEDELLLMAQMHKAITIIQMKLEAQVIRRRPEYNMADRLLLDKIDLQKGTINLNGQTYPLLDTHFPTLERGDPYALTERERNVVERLNLSFSHSERLQRHMRFLLSKGGMYRVHNRKLLYHGCIPMDPDGAFTPVKADGDTYTARSLMDRFDRLVRQGFLANDPQQRELGGDAMWYLWSGEHSPLFGKGKMATFERYFLTARETHLEKMNPYYDYRDKEGTANRILEAFGLDPQRSHIVNGHVKKGENPVKAGGRLLVIDGGFSKAYQEKTGIAGYTLISNSQGLLLASHEPFQSTQQAIEEGQDMRSRTEILETYPHRFLVKYTDQGREMQSQIADLEALLHAYRSGILTT
jgi:fructose-1,6-bisphosphatase-3